MKIGILTLFHRNYNWGGVLQGYALKTLLEKDFENVQADLLIYRGRNVVYENKLRQALQYSFADACKKVVKRLKRNDGCRGKLATRYALFDAFMKENTTNPRKYNDESLVEAAGEYDCLISGSDQVWNPNVGCAGYFQKMISNECRKVAYAASIARDDLSVHERKVMLPLIKRFDAVSVREKTAKQVLEKYSDGQLQVTEVLDPTMMLSREDWDQIAEKSTVNFEGQYAVAFFFSESEQYRRKIAEYCLKRNLRLKFIPFAQGSYISSDEEGDADRLYDLGPTEFVNLFRNAQCVFTDSFHGAVFSIIFQKPFCVFERDKKSKVSKNSRLYDLLDKFGLYDRLVMDVSQLETAMEKSISYARVSELREQHKEDSMIFLRNALSACTEHEAVKNVHVGELKEHLCSGCSLCVSLCPQKCITMRQNAEGFLYPAVDENKCVQCGRCLQVCEQKKHMEKPVCHDAYIGFHEDGNVRTQSSSGGLFYALASQVIRAGGCVYGAAYNSDFSVQHIRVDCLEDLPRLMTSKYLQSKTDGIFEMVLEDLRKERQVLFSGTPCQVGAVDYYVQKIFRKDNLILVDFICHGVPSPGVWQLYTRYLECTHNFKITDVSFRDKSKGWHDYHLRVASNRTKILTSHEMDAYMRSFLSDKNLRKSCYQCDFKDKNYVSDITLGDAWKVEQIDPSLADDKGTSLFVIRTDKGKKLLERMEDQFIYRATDYASWERMNPSLVHSTSIPVGRKAFFEDYQTMECNAFWKKYSKIPGKKRVRYGLKRIARMIGIEKTLRKIRR